MMNAEPKRAMIRFLLGDMPDQERASFEDQYIKDADLFHELVELENDLLDLYALGALSRSERQRLERSFLADPERSKRLPFARALIAESESGTADISLPRARSGLSWLRFPRRAVVSVAAAVILSMFTGILWLMMENRDLRLALKKSQEQRVAASEETARLRRELDAQNRKPMNGNWSGGYTETASNSAVLTFTLQADVLRGEGAMPKLVVPPTASAVAFHLIFSADPSLRYNVSVETISGTRIWYQNHVKGTSTSAGPQGVVASVPTSVLKEGNYVVRVTARSSDGLEDVVGYSFTIVKH